VTATRDWVLQHFPWRVIVEQGQAPVLRSLHDHAEFVVTGGAAMPDHRLKRLRAFYRALREADVVVEYNPDIPPQPGLSRKGGFALRPRRPTDGDLMIRINEYTRLTTEGRNIWRLPEDDPPSGRPS